MTRLTLTLALLAAPVLAETPLTAEEFDAAVTGRTLTWADPLGGFGIERYARDRRVIWQSGGGDCLDGTWYADGPDICFLYGGPEDPHCWQFFAGPKGLTAISQPGGSVLTEVTGAKDPLICPEFGS
jgi:hypothetical protein